MTQRSGLFIVFAMNVDHSTHSTYSYFTAGFLKLHEQYRSILSQAKPLQTELFREISQSNQNIQNMIQYFICKIDF